MDIFIITNILIYRLSIKYVVIASGRVQDV